MTIRRSAQPSFPVFQDVERLAPVSRERVSLGQVGQHDAVFSASGYGPLKTSKSFAMVALSKISRSKIEQCGSVIWVHFQRLVVLLNRLILLPALVINPSDHIVNDQRQRIEFLRTANFYHGF